MQSRLFFSNWGKRSVRVSASPFQHFRLVPPKPSFLQTITKKIYDCDFILPKIGLDSKGASVAEETTRNDFRPADGRGVFHDGLTRPELSDHGLQRRSAARLAEYLDIRDLSARAKYWNGVKSKDDGIFFSSILVHYMHLSSTEQSSWTGLDDFISYIADGQLKSKSLTWKDVESWAYALSAYASDEKISRLFSSKYRIQPFAVIEILRHDLHRVDSLRILLEWTWSLVLAKSPQNSQPITNYSQQQQDIMPPNMQCKSSSSNSTLDTESAFLNKSMPQHLYSDLDDMTFRYLVMGLLRQARRIWPAAMETVAHLISPYVSTIVSRENADPGNLEPILLRRLCDLVNEIIRKLARPAVIEPFKSMTHNWNSQRILLKLAMQYQPALVLNRASYTSIIEVLMALKRPEHESRSALLRSQNWPPWKIAQDGMDTEGEETSRVVTAINRLQEAGYDSSCYEDALKVLGGQDVDGSPTIAQRRIMSRRPIEIAKFPAPKHQSTSSEQELDPILWAARVMATRNVQEAWSAFQEYRRQCDIPDQRVYLAMFEKLHFEKKRHWNRSYHVVTPGDGLEVLPVADNNFSDHYKRSLEPSSIETLFTEMLSSGIIPSGRCLSFLVRNANTVEDGFRFLFAAGLTQKELQFLGAFGQDNIEIAPEISDIILSDFISLICRFVPRAVRISPTSKAATYQYPRKRITVLGQNWAIVQRATKTHGSKILIPQPLHHCAFLLHAKRPLVRPPWYSFFQALGVSNVIISQDLIGQPKGEVLAWNVMKAAFGDFKSSGLELDCQGFLLICKGFEKYVTVASNVQGEDHRAIYDACQLVKAEFKKLIRTADSDEFYMPKFLHPIRGVHIHNYLRCMGIVQDLEEIMTTLRWMAGISLLEDTAVQDRNGIYQFGQVLIVIRLYLEGTGFEPEAKRLVNSIEWLSGWPEDHEVEDYLDGSRKINRGGQRR